MLNPALESGVTDATENNNVLLIAARQMNAEAEENYSIDTLLLALEKNDFLPLCSSAFGK